MCFGSARHRPTAPGVHPDRRERPRPRLEYCCERLFGYAKEEAIDQVCVDLIVPLPLRGHLQELLGRIRSGDMQAHSINENRTKDGRLITCQWHNTPLVASDGRFAGIISLAEDITQRDRVERALEESHALCVR